MTAFRTTTNFAESPLTFAGRPHMGQRSLRRVDKAGHMIAIDSPVSLLIFLLHPRGRSLIAPPLSIDSCLLVMPYRGHGSLRGRKDPPQHLVRSTGAAMSTAGSHCSLCGPRPSCAAACTLAPSGNHHIRGDAPDEAGWRDSSGRRRLLGPAEWLARAPDAVHDHRQFPGKRDTRLASA